MNKDIVLNCCLFFLGFSLVFRDQLSTIALIVFCCLHIIFNILEKQKITFNVLFLIPAVLVLSRLMGFLNGIPEIAAKELVRSLPFIILFIPFVFYRIVKTQKFDKTLYYGILLGLFVFFLICNFHVVSNIITKDQPWEYLFRWRYLNVNFVKPIETHPPYVGVVVVFALVQTVYNTKIKEWIKILISLFLFIFLFQLLARNALIVAILVLFYSFLSKLSLARIALAIIVIGSICFVIYSHPHPYLKEKLIDKLNFTESMSFDRRLNRLEPSINVFRSSPILGVGPGYDNILRKEQYQLLNFDIAFKNNYNSHNQYIEYLVSSGIIGFILFMALVLTLFLLLIRAKDESLIICLAAFCIACFTESTLERSLGIKYFSLLIFLILTKYFNVKRALKN